MKLKPLSFFLISILFICCVSCKSNSNTEDEQQKLDSIQKADSMAALRSDSITTVVNPVDTTKKVFKDPAVQEAHVEIVKKYGVQWDLCKCIEKQDSVNKALMSASDAAFDKVKKRSDFIDSKCKDMLIHPNTTPAERAAWKKKIRDCKEANK